MAVVRRRNTRHIGNAKGDEMTNEEIYNMPAGTEIEELILQHIFGFELLPPPAMPKFQRPTNHGVETIDYPRPYSTDIWSAWSITDKLPMLELFRYLDDDEETPAGWVARFDNEYEATAEYAPLAICRAALLAVMDAK
jgi:hypothetical protein